MKRHLIPLAAILLAGGALAADVKDNWDKVCAKCHGADGKGNTRMGRKVGVKDYTDAKVQAEMKDDVAFKNTKEGMSENGKERMPAYKDKLSDDEIKALITFVRAFKK